MNENKILHVVKSNVFNGAENVVCQIINMFKNEFEMLYCSPKGKIEEVLDKRNIKYIELIKFSPIYLKKIIAKNSISTIHAHDPAACVLSALSFSRKKIIAHVHGNHTNMRTLTLKSLLFLLASLKFHTIIWVSESCMKDYIFCNLVKNKSIVLVNNIDANEVYIKAEKNNKVKYDCIYLGRLSSEKNPLRAIDIIKNVVDVIPNYCMVFVGEGVLYNECINYVKELNLERNIEFMGYKNNPFPYLNQSNILLMTSIYEGTPMSALEAMCLGKPIVSTPTDGLIDLIQLNETGFYSNKNQEISEFLIKAKEDNDFYTKLSIKTKEQFMKLNDTDKYKECLKRIYEK